MKLTIHSVALALALSYSMSAGAAIQRANSAYPMTCYGKGSDQEICAIDVGPEVAATSELEFEIDESAASQAPSMLTASELAGEQTDLKAEGAPSVAVQKDGDKNFAFSQIEKFQIQNDRVLSLFRGQPMEADKFENPIIAKPELKTRNRQ